MLNSSKTIANDRKTAWSVSGNCFPIAYGLKSLTRVTATSWLKAALLYTIFVVTYQWPWMECCQRIEEVDLLFSWTASSLQKHKRLFLMTQNLMPSSCSWVSALTKSKPASVAVFVTILASRWHPVTSTSVSESTGKHRVLNLPFHANHLRRN